MTNGSKPRSWVRIVAVLLVLGAAGIFGGRLSGRAGGSGSDDQGGGCGGGDNGGEQISSAHEEAAPPVAPLAPAGKFEPIEAGIELARVDHDLRMAANASLHALR